MDFSSQLLSAWPELEPPQIERISFFYDRLVRENEIQNLTRLISPTDFIEGHLLDVKAAFASAFIQYPAIDLGSGGGIPGLLMAVIQSEKWILVESEVRKADFLSATVEEMGLKEVKVIYNRLENVLRDLEVGSIAARAVGKVEKVYGWVERCSTWNNLVLFKGPGWEAEWAEFNQSRYRNRLKIDGEYDYKTGAEGKTRKLVQLSKNSVRRTV